MSFAGFPEDKNPGDWVITGSDKAGQVRAGHNVSQADLARNGNQHMPEVERARGGNEPSRRYPMRTPSDWYFEGDNTENTAYPPFDGYFD